MSGVHVGEGIIYVTSQFSLANFKILWLFDSLCYILGIDLFELVLSGVLLTSWTCWLVLFINFVKFSTIISAIFYLPSLKLSLCLFYMVGTFYIVFEVLFVSFLFLLFHKLDINVLIFKVFYSFYLSVSLVFFILIFIV
jgi:hypothetical protein